MLRIFERWNEKTKTKRARLLRRSELKQDRRHYCQKLSTLLSSATLIYFHPQDEFCAAVDDLKTRERTSNEGIKEINYDCPETEQLYGIGYHKVIQIEYSYIYLHWLG